MEVDEENSSSSSSMKRTRAPLSDSEDNVLPSLEANDNQKRRRLEAAGQENRSPKPSSSGRFVELETKPDTPIVPSVRSRVQQLSQRRDGGPPLAQRCLSDPGADSPAVFRETCLREHLLGEGEFHQRMERFKVPVFQASPAPAKSPVFPSPRTCSNFVSGIQQKLQCTTIPSLQQASRMREERRQELSKLQPISENAWLKRSSSDSSLTQADNDAEMKDGSFTEVLTSGAEKRSSNQTGTLCETPTASIELENCNEGLLQKEQKEGDTLQGEGVLEDTEHKGLFVDEGSQQSHSQTILKLTFTEDHSFSNTPSDGHPDELFVGDEESLLESTLPEKSNMEETGEVSNITEQGSSDMFTCKDAEETRSYSYSEEEIEPSTDEELRMWRYPQDKVCKEKQSVAEEQQIDARVTETEGLDLSSGGKGDNVADGSAFSDIQSKEGYFAFAAETSCSSEVQEDKNHRPKKELESESCLGDLVKEHCTLNRDQGNVESSEGIQTGVVDICTKQTDQEDIDRYTRDDAICQQANESVMINVLEDISGESDKNVEPTLMEVQTDKQKVDTQAESSHVGGSDGDQRSRDGQVSSDHPLEETEQDAVNTRQEVVEAVTKKGAVGGESSKKVTFILEPELINHPILNESNISMEETAETHMSELSTNDEADTGQIIDQMFEEVLEYAEKIEDERVVNDEEHDSGIGACCGGRDKLDMEVEKGKSEEDENPKEDECDEGKLEDNEEELLSFPPSGILSPLSKSVEAVVTPLRLTVNQESNHPSRLLTPEETSTPPAEPAPLYSVDAYRTQRQTKNPTIQSVTPGVQRRVPQKSQPQPSVNTKEKIAALNEEAGKLQNVINQTLQALSCCTDEEHGRGSLEEAEAEKLLLVSCEKRSALLSEITQLREQKSSESEETSGNDTEYVSQLPCRGTVSITNIQLPLKVEFVCSSHNRPGRPSHYFFILIRYGPCNIIATPLATAADAQNGDTISFPTSVTLKDIRSSFEIDVEVYSLSHTSSSNCTMDRTTTKSRATPKKLLNTITRSNNSLTSAGSRVLNTRRSSNFCLVGSHKITLASLGHSRFPLDKMKLEGKIKRLLGDEFQEKVPFLSPLEGHIYLQLDSQGHSNVQHQGFLTMFELISGFGVWNRRYLVLEGCTMYYWNHPNDRETKKAEGSISLSTSSYQSVRPVKRDSCARPFTFELVSNVLQHQDDSLSALAKCWFSADTKQERLDWMEKLGQALLDFHTWNRTSATKAESRQSDASSGGSLRESIL